MNFNYYEEKIRYYNVTYSINELLNQISEEYIILNKDKYRNFIWSNKQCSLFIDSLLRGFPTPNIFLYQDIDDTFTLIDGVQRLRTIHAFYNNKIKLKDGGDEYNNHYFNELPSAIQRRFMNSMLNVTIIESISTNANTIIELFYRLNAGGEKMSNQEFRNRLYFGDMLDSVNQLNNQELWREAYGKSVDNRFRDSEYILRFFAYLEVNDYKSKLDFELINSFLQYNRNNVNKAVIFGDIFNKTLESINDSDAGMELLKHNGRFSSILFDLIFIPVGKFIKDGRKFDILNAYRSIIYLIEERKIQHLSTSKRVLLGMRLLAGDDFGI